MRWCFGYWINGTSRYSRWNCLFRTVSRNTAGLLLLRVCLWPRARSDEGRCLTRIETRNYVQHFLEVFSRKHKPTTEMFDYMFKFLSLSLLSFFHLTLALSLSLSPFISRCVPRVNIWNGDARRSHSLSLSLTIQWYNEPFPVAHSYLCRAKMLLLLLIPCLYWKRESNAFWDGCYYRLPATVCSASIFVACVLHLQSVPFIVLQRWVGVRFFPYIIHDNDTFRYISLCTVPSNCCCCCCWLPNSGTEKSEI